MAIQEGDVQRGMEVLSADGQKLGTVTGVRYMTPAGEGNDRGPGAAEAPPRAQPGAGGLNAVRGYGTPGDERGVPMTGGAGAESLAAQRGAEQPPPAPVPPAARPGVIMIEDAGVFGVGAGALHVPFSAVFEVVPGQRIVLECTRAEAEARYGNGPGLDLDRSVTA